MTAIVTEKILDADKRKLTRTDCSWLGSKRVVATNVRFRFSGKLLEKRHGTSRLILRTNQTDNSCGEVSLIVMSQWVPLPLVATELFCGAGKKKQGPWWSRSEPFHLHSIISVLWFSWNSILIYSIQSIDGQVKIERELFDSIVVCTRCITFQHFSNHVQGCTIDYIALSHVCVYVYHLLMKHPLACNFIVAVH